MWSVYAIGLILFVKILHNRFYFLKKEWGSDLQLLGPYLFCVFLNMQ